MRKEEEERTGREGSHTKQKQLHWKDKEAGKNTHVWFVQGIFKGTESKKFRIEVWTLSSHFILQKLLHDKEIHEKNTVSSEIKDQICQEPLKEEEYKKLRDILQQRDNEISILSEAIRNCPSAGLTRGVGELRCLPHSHTTYLPTLLSVHIVSFHLEIKCLFSKQNGATNEKQSW